MNIPDFTTVQWIGIGFAAWCIASPFLGVLIGKWLARCAARHPLHDLSDKQADFASVPTLTVTEGFGGAIEVDADEALIQRAVAAYHGVKL